MKRSSWLPWLILIGGAAMYVWDGLQWGSWMKNLPNVIVFAVIVAGLWWALRKKESFKD